MNAHAHVVPRIDLLTRMLGSPVDGEALAACRALEQTLDANGLDFHWVADVVVERAAVPAVVEQPRQEAPPVPKLKPWLLTAMHCIRAATEQLKPAELDFHRGMVHWPAEPSEPQTRWLDAIAGALGIEVAR